MFPRTVRSKLFLVMCAVSVLFIGTNLILTTLLVKRVAEEEIVRELHSSKKAFDQFFETAKAVLEDKTRSIALTPHLVALLSIETLYRETAKFTAYELEEVAKVHVVALFNTHGQLLGRNSAAASSSDQSFDATAIERALAGNSNTIVQRLGSSQYLLSAVPVDDSYKASEFWCLAEKSTTSSPDKSETRPDATFSP